MTMMDANRVFVDTNILLRATITQFPLHEQAKRLVDDQIEAGAELWISRQVIREYIGQVTRPQLFMNPMTIEQVEEQITIMRALFKIADEMEAVTVNLLALLREHAIGGKQVHDANVVATMITYSIHALLTANVKDFNRFKDKIRLIPLEVKNP
jgi:predicted nucleic acid-binding protein